MKKKQEADNALDPLEYLSRHSVVIEPQNMVELLAPAGNFISLRAVEKSIKT